MAYSAISDGEIDLDSPITVSLMTKIRDNIEQGRTDHSATAVSNSDSSTGKLFSVVQQGSSESALVVQGRFVETAQLSISRSGQSITIGLTTTYSSWIHTLTAAPSDGG